MAQVTKGPACGIGATIGYGAPAGKVGRALEGVPEDQLFTMTLNGREVKARKGETIMEVCHREDTYVPHYCWHPSLSIAGNCRLCLVEVEKVPKPIIACQTQVSPGMVVKSASEQAKTAQEWMMEFLLVNHPLDCPICDRGGECQLQRYSMEYGTSHSRMADKKRKYVKPQADPLIDIERNRCIMCTRCVRFCDEVGGDHVMGVFARGNDNYIGTFGQGPVSNIFSGNVIDLCPVGCLTSKPFRFKARVWELTQTQTTCTQCSSGCKVTSWTRNGRLYRTTPPSRQRHDHFTINEDTEEFICNQGRFGADFSAHDSRRGESLVRRADRLEPAPFGDAVARAGKALREVVERHGGESVAILLSPRATNEEGLLARKLARDVVGTWSVDWRANQQSVEAANAVSAALRVADGDLESEPDVVVIVNGDIAHQSPVLALRIQELGRRHLKKIVMLGHYHDPYLAGHAAMSFHNAPGRTAEILAQLAGVLAGEASVADLASSLGRTEEDVRELVDTIKSAQSGLLVQSLQDFDGRYAPAEVPAAGALRAALGEGWGWLPVTGERNAVGLNALGCEPGEHGIGARGLLDAIGDGRIKAVVAIGADAIDPLGNEELLAGALSNLDAFVLADSFDSPYSRLATVFLGMAGNLETDGTAFDIEGNIALVKAGVDPVGDSRQGWRILTELGRALGRADFGADSIEDVWTQVRAELAADSDATLAALELEGGTNAAQFVVQRPAGGARNRAPEHNPGNYRTDGLHLRSAAFEAPKAGTAPSSSDPASAADGFLLTWGPHVSGRGYLQNRASIAEMLLPKPFLEVHPADAAAIGVKTNQFAVLHVNGLRTKVGIKVGRGPARGTVYMSAGVYGPFDPSSNAGPVEVRIEPLDELVPDQGEALIAAESAPESH